ncbi:hypothetical protein LMG3441_04302 [Achromobacter kerstersii]|jgi:fimbrial chaperone protein|uniref:Pili assembly chaperone N-terminal domain-containing protein n=2 Tax=Achromobacter kerstersii TaxID=1353890 RepID=A0A6S7ADC2_9BURK|nr:hypothetical protein LMG3441_04302 [Achromobacter kerstersii]
MCCRRALVRLLFCGIATGLAALPGRVSAAMSILIWPINPVIESSQRASSLWLENRGSTAAHLQLRIFEWTQQGNENSYAEQRDVIGSPPMMRIAPGQKQFVRLTRPDPLPAGVERAYRIVIDEVPVDDGALPEEGRGVNFQMRYSVPLFAYGEGLIGKPQLQGKPRHESDGAQGLGWSVVTLAGKAHLEVRNQGSMHARLTQVSLEAGKQKTTVSDGLLGYVLPGSVMRWPLPEGARARGEGVLRARINGGPTLHILTRLP